MYLEVPFTAFYCLSLPVTELSVPFTELSLTFHCLSLTFNCLWLTFPCPFIAFQAVAADDDGDGSPTYRAMVLDVEPYSDETDSILYSWEDLRSLTRPPSAAIADGR